jgi:hypothetical protein
MGRGSIGDVTFYRADGQQLSRVRNRRPKNPKSQAQLYQRAIMATVIKAYQAGKEIFDHSFQGYSVGAQNQRQFMSLNSKMLRQLVATDINSGNPASEQIARVVAPGANTPVANPYIISRGSYQQSQWSLNSDPISFSLPEPANASETVAAYVQRVGLIPGDIFTFVVFAEKEDIAYESPFYDDAVSFLNYCDFGWVRMIVKSGAASDTETVDDLSSIFDFQTSGGAFAISSSAVDTILVGQPVGIAQLLANATGYLNNGALGLIRSRIDQDLRSDSSMYVVYGSDADDMFGIAPEYLLGTWSAGTVQVGDSELILEGGDA